MHKSGRDATLPIDHPRTGVCACPPVPWAQAADETPTMVKRPQDDASQVASLAAGLSRTIVADAQSLGDALHSFDHHLRGDVALDRTVVLGELQASFKTLARCVLMLRTEIDRVSAIAST